MYLNTCQLQNHQSMLPMNKPICSIFLYVDMGFLNLSLAILFLETYYLADALQGYLPRLI